MIRKATIGDIPQILEWGRAMHLESGYSELDFSVAKIVGMARRMVGATSECLFVSDNGFFAGGMAEYWFGGDRKTFDYALYIEPESRGSSQSVRLVRAYIEWARSVGAKRCHIANTTEVNIERVEKFFLALGFKRIGGNFVMTL